MTTETRTAKEIAAEIATAMASQINDSELAPKVWSPDGRDFARVYTGLRGEYVHVNADGSARMSRDRMAWSHVISEIIADVTA